MTTVSRLHNAQLRNPRSAVSFTRPGGRPRAISSRERMKLCCVWNPFHKKDTIQRTTFPHVWIHERDRPVRVRHHTSLCVRSIEPSDGPGDGQDPKDGLRMTEPGLQAMDFTLVIYGCTALYFPTVVYGLGAFFLSSSTALNTLSHYLPQLLVKTLAQNFEQIIGFHHLLLNFSICLSLIPALRQRWVQLEARERHFSACVVLREIQ